MLCLRTSSAGPWVCFTIVMAVFIGTLFFFASHVSQGVQMTMQQYHSNTMNDLVTARQNNGGAAIATATTIKNAADTQNQIEEEVATAAATSSSIWFLMSTAGGGKGFDDLIRRHGWQGVILEEVPEQYVALNEAYKDLWPRVTVENAGLCVNPGMTAVDPEQMFGMKFVEENMGGGGGNKKKGGTLPPLMVPCTTLKSVVEKYHPQQWEYLQVGYQDCHLLSFEKFPLKPNFIDLTGSFILAKTCENSLNSQGYSFVRQNGLSIILELQ